MSAKVCKRTLCVKNLPQPSDNLVSSLFGPLGGNLLKVITTSDNNRKDILVEFESEELASKAREAMHGKTVEGTNLFVDYAILGQPSFTSPSKEKAQKQKVSVLDRIIKPGNNKSSKVEDKPTVLGGQAGGKEGMGSDNPDINNISQQKPFNEGEFEKGQVVSQPNIVKKGKGGGNPQQNNGNLEGKNNKKHYNTQAKGRGKMQRKLEIIKPKQIQARVQEPEIIITPKEVSTIMKDNPELTGNPQLVKQVIEIVQKKFETNNMDLTTRTGSKSRPLDSTDKKRPYSRSRSRSQGHNYPRSNSGNNVDPYYYPRRSRSPSHQRPALRPRSRSRSRSYDKYANKPRDLSYSSHRGGDRAEPYHDDRYRNPYYRRSRSRSISRRGEYSPDRERPIRRDDPRYDYRDRNSRERSRSRSHPRRSRSRSWSRSRSRHGYDDYRRGPSKSRSRSRSGYRDSSYRRDDQRPVYKDKFVTKGGLVVEKKNNNNTATKKYDGSYGNDRYKQRGYSRSKSRDRVYSRSRSRDRRPSPGQRPNDYLRYRDDRSYERRPEVDRNKKALDTRKDNNPQHQHQNQHQNQHQQRQRQQQQDFRNRKLNNNPKQQNERNRDPINLMPREKLDLTGVVMGSESKDLEPVTTSGANQAFGNYNMNLPNMSYFPNHMLHFANPSGGPHIPVQQSSSSLPSYLYSSTMMESNVTPLINPVSMAPSATGVSLPPEATAMQQEYTTEPNKGEMSGEKVVNKQNTREEIEISNIENSTTENSNIDTKEKMEVEHKKEGFSDLSEQTTAEADAESITNDFIKKNKMQAFINYILATGDTGIQGLKEKLKSMEKPKDSK